MLRQNIKSNYMYDKDTCNTKKFKKKFKRAVNKKLRQERKRKSIKKKKRKINRTFKKLK